MTADYGFLSGEDAALIQRSRTLRAALRSLCDDTKVLIEDTEAFLEYLDRHQARILKGQAAYSSSLSGKLQPPSRSKIDP